MKILSAILAILILSLSAQPVLAIAGFIANDKAADKCCAGKIDAAENKTGKSNGNDCCNDGHCNNPFLSCSNCCFVQPEKQSSLAPSILIQKEKFRLISDKVSSSYKNDVWHPPNCQL